ncbi:reverse transcriptase domain-containing protein [Tanacetum coccineum]
MMEKVLTDQRGRNVEVYLEEIVVKSKSEQSLVQDVKETLRKLKRVNIKIDLNTSSFGVEEGKFLGHMVTKEGLTTIGKFIPKLAELNYPINKVHMRMDVAAGFGWTNKDEEAFQMIKRKLNKLKGRSPNTCLLCKTTATRNGDMLHPYGKHGASFNSYNKIHEDNLQQTQGSSYNRWTNGGNNEALKKGNTIRKIGCKIQTYGFFVHTKKGGQRISSEDILSRTRRAVQENTTSPDEKMHSYAIRLKFNASDHAMDCEALLAGLVAYVNKGMKDLHVFIDSLTLVAQIEGNHTPAMEQERKYKVGTPLKLEFSIKEVLVGIKTKDNRCEEISWQLEGKKCQLCDRDKAKTTIGRYV